jgi:hypothetical protein
VDRMWDGLVPWLGNTDDEPAALREAVARLTMRCCWLMAIFVTAVMALLVGFALQILPSLSATILANALLRAPLAGLPCARPPCGSSRHPHHDPARQWC